MYVTITVSSINRCVQASEASRGLYELSMRMQPESTSQAARVVGPRNDATSQARWQACTVCMYVTIKASSKREKQAEGCVCPRCWQRKQSAMSIMKEIVCFLLAVSLVKQRQDLLTVCWLYDWLRVAKTSSEMWNHHNISKIRHG